MEQRNLTALSWPPADCQPQIAEIVAYWRAIAPPGRLPGRQHLDPLTIPTPLLPKLWLLDVAAAPAPLRWRFRYRLVGTEMVDGFNREVTGQWLDEVWPHLVGPTGTYGHYVDVVEHARPSFRRGSPIFDDHHTYKWLERILLPMARDGVRVDMILALTTYFIRAPFD